MQLLDLTQTSFYMFVFEMVELVICARAPARAPKQFSKYVLALATRSGARAHQRPIEL